jgi:hypothetical protein
MFLLIAVGKAWMAAFLMAGFVAGYAKTDYPTYIERHRKQQARTGDGFRESIKDFHPAVRIKVKMERRRKP